MRDPSTGSPECEAAAELWSAVLERNRAFDGRFVYAVRSTGVYCRPTCPSRRPLVRHVRFFDSSRAAERAGFRACRRCRPRDAEAPNATECKVLAACRFLETHAGRIPTLAELGTEVGISPSHLQRVFRRMVGVSPRQYADALRVERLKKELRGGEAIAGALYQSGYGSSSRLYERTGAQLGMTPGSYRRGAPGERIRSVIVRCRLGWLLVAATERGICSVRLADRASELREELRREFAEAELVPDDGGLRAWVGAIVDSLAGPRELAALPCDVRATAFQREVWEAIRAIPRGSTLTYGELAASLGRPSAVRAVAHACARNPAALVIPCHRVVPATGGAGKYRWGSARKEELLRVEKRRR